VELGDCSACHDPHGGAGKLLRTTPVALCLGCHATGKEGFVASHVHRPEPTGDCLSCHDPHAADAPRLVTRPEETLCAACHGAGLAARRAGGDKLHTPFVGGNCAACHAPHAGGKAGLRPGDVCAGCHVGTRATWTKGQSVHSPFVDGSCQDCHDPHGSKQPAMLKEGPNALCGGCHPEIADGLAKPGAVVHDAVKDGACTDCHGGHGSIQPDLLLHEPAVLCAECHDVEGEEAVAAHGGPFAGKDCTTCHVAHAGPKAKLLK
jgi:predicted CXXCH cytochrome family protein